MKAQPTPYKGIDAHQHFWRYDATEHAWITDEMQAIRRDFLPADLEPLLKKNGMSGCIAVQAAQTEQETDFLITLSEKHDFIKGVVGWVDLRSDNISGRLEHYKRYPVVKGFRHILQGEDPAFMSQPSFLRGIGRLREFGFTYDVLVYPHHLAAVLSLVQRFPEQPFVIDHLAKPLIKQNTIDGWSDAMRAIAQHPNVYCKVSGMVTEADWRNWKKEDLYPYLDVVTEAFGTDRLMYGSDWPVCLVAASYESMMEPVREYYASFPTEEQEKISGNNAIQFYHL